MFLNSGKNALFCTLIGITFATYVNKSIRNDVNICYNIILTPYGVIIGTYVTDISLGEGIY